MPTVTLPQGPVSYREEGTGPPVLFVHGVLANGDLWAEVVPAVAAAGLRCIAPDWPLGAHRLPMEPDADLSPTGIADLVAAFARALELEDVTLVANDSGDAITTLVLSRHPSFVGRVVLTSGDLYEHFFPPRFRPLQWASRVPGGTWLTVQLLRVRALHRLPNLFGRLTHGSVPDSFLAPSRASAAIRRDLRTFLRGVDSRLTVEADLSAFAGPVLLAWARGDTVFPESLARRLAAQLLDARVELIDDTYSFVPLDQPARLAELIATFAAAPLDGTHI